MPKQQKKVFTAQFNTSSQRRLAVSDFPLQKRDAMGRYDHLSISSESVVLLVIGVSASYILHC